MNFSKQVSKKVGKNAGGFDSFVHEYQKANGLLPGRPLDKATKKDLYTRYKKAVEYGKEFAKSKELEYRWSNGFAENQKLNKVHVKDLKNTIKREWDDLAKADGSIPKFIENGRGAPNFLHPENFIDEGRKIKGIGENAADGIALGGSAGLSSLAIHALGEKYFDKKDDDKVRELIRTSYNSDKKKSNDDRRRTPTQRADQYNRRQMNKQASLEKIVDKARKVDVAKGLRHAGEISAAGVIDAALITGMPIAIQKATGVDIRKGLRKPEEVAEDQNNIVIDVPLTSIKKKANLNGAADDVVEKLTKKEFLKKFLGKRMDTATRVLPWSIAAGTIAGAASKDDTKALPPLADGNARITIQTKPKPRAINTDILMRSASFRGDQDHDVSDDAEDLLEDIRESIRASSEDNTEEGLKKAIAFVPRDGEVGKSYKFRKES